FNQELHKGPHVAPIMAASITTIAEITIVGFLYHGLPILFDIFYFPLS
ncbi:unnamed protein product, partial [marine sediment metagenome]